MPHSQNHATCSEIKNVLKERSYGIDLIQNQQIKKGKSGSYLCSFLV
jgi:hypothetical protein